MSPFLLSSIILYDTHATLTAIILHVCIEIFCGMSLTKYLTISIVFLWRKFLLGFFHLLQIFNCQTNVYSYECSGMSMKNCNFQFPSFPYHVFTYIAIMSFVNMWFTYTYMLNMFFALGVVVPLMRQLIGLYACTSAYILLTSLHSYTF